MAEMGYVWEQVAAEIERRIADGRRPEGERPADALPPGAMLRNERAMAEELGVATGTLRRAVAHLSERGLLTVLPHKGTYVTE